MLKLVNIKKDYIMGDTKVEALKGINLNIRKNEFVSILGPSGCGKTTLLNIIGGLDKYTDGDLVINGVSTKEFTDRDWDVYRNHRIGFIFQSYNLIPHQTILENVELALTIAGMEKNERVEKAKNALDKVGLKGQYNKKPNQLSGGQCQRVAIARALVNEPEILLADEPTGALDTTTSIQIMDLIKEISKEKLVIMVTHNPDLAEKYSTRIVKLLDGEVSSDSMVCSNEEEQKEKFANSATPEKAKMSFWTAFRLSARNLMCKLKRTLMVGFAGSIGIIGVSVVLALSSGITDYINSMQEDMLSGNPITITEQAYDINAMMNSMTRSEKKEILKESNYIYVDSILEKLAKRAEKMNSILVTNEINEDYVAYLKNMPSSYLESLAFDYGVDLSFSIYTDFTVNNKTRSTSIATIKNIYASLLEETEFKESSSAVSTLSQAFTQLLPNKEYLLSQYDLVDGKMATEKNEIMLVVDRNSEVSDLILAQLGYYTEEEFLNAAYKAFDKNNEKIQNFLYVSDYDFKATWSEIRENYIENGLYKTMVGSETYAESFITSEWLYYSLKGKENFDYTAIVSGYLKSIEQLLYKLVMLNIDNNCVISLKRDNETKQKVVNNCIIVYEIRNHKKKIVKEGWEKWLKYPYIDFCEKQKEYMDSSIGIFEFFLRNNPHIFIDPNLAKVICDMVSCFRTECRNGYFHTHNLHDTSIVDKTRENAILLYAILVGCIKQTKVKKDKLGISVEDEFDSICKEIRKIRHYSPNFIFEYADGSKKLMIYDFINNTLEYTEDGIEHYESLIFFDVEDFSMETYEKLETSIRDEWKYLLTRDNLPNRIYCYDRKKRIHEVSGDLLKKSKSY